MSKRVGLLALLLVLGLADGAWAQMPNQRGSRAGDIIGWLICAGVCVLVGIGVHIASMVYTVRDARKRGMDPLFWFIIEFFVNPVGLIVYLIARQPLLPEFQKKKKPKAEKKDDRPRKKAKAEPEDEDEDDRPSQRRPRDDEGEDDPPRRRGRAAKDDEDDGADDRPRRRGRDDSDDEEDRLRRRRDKD